LTHTIDNTHQLFKYKDIIGNLNILLADDDNVSLMILNNLLLFGFKEILTAKNGFEALEIVKSNKIDLIITDNIMPVMSGLDMIREYKKICPETPPVILVTGFIDTDYLIDCINLGVTQFLVKPINRETLYNAVEFSIKNVIVEKLHNTLRDKEIELLKFKQQNDLIQHELAYKKEKNIIRNDFLVKKIENKNDWLIDIASVPHDVLSGDIYSIRQLDNDKVFIILFDGMGKGISAALSTIVSVSFINYFIDDIKKNNIEASLLNIIISFLGFIKKNILDDEIISASFILLDFKNEILSCSIFGNPPIYLKKEGGEIICFKSNNLPISRYIQAPLINEISLNNVNTVFIYSDGINEAPTNQNTLYQNYIEADLSDSIFLKDFLRNFNERISGIEDDMTVLSVNRLNLKPFFQKNFVIKSKINELVRLSSEIESFLHTEFNDENLINTHLTVFTELLMNAFEHGSLNINLNQKLLKIDKYDQYISDIEKTVDKNIYIELKFFLINGKKVFQTTIKDEGDGFLTDVIKNTIFEKQIPNEAGRGILISKQMVDLFYYNSKGNEVSFNFILS